MRRNHFDRFVHFAFGLLLTYPIFELLVRAVRVQPGWALGLAILAIMATSGFFEVIEAWVAQLVSPQLGTAYLGTQGDEWDAQKDMTMAIGGTFLATMIYLIAEITFDRSRSLGAETKIHLSLGR